MSDRNAVDHRSRRRNRPRLRLLQFNRNRVLSHSEAAVGNNVRNNVRNNVKHVALNSRSSLGRNARSRSSHAVNRSRLSVAPVRPRQNGPGHPRDKNSRMASVSQHQRHVWNDLRRRLALNRSPNQNTSVHRRRSNSNSNSLSRSVATRERAVIPEAVILERAKARNHKQ
jgi:hypothetical protein